MPHFTSNTWQKHLEMIISHFPDTKQTMMKRSIGLLIHWTYCKIYTSRNLHCSKWDKISRLCERKNCCSACSLVNKSRHLRKKLLILWARLLLGMSMEIKICFPIQILIKIIIIILYWSVLTFFKLVLYFFMKCKQGAIWP